MARPFKAVREEVRRGLHPVPVRRGWHGESVRHGLASKGIRTARNVQAKSKPSTVRDREVMERVNREMDRILDFQDTFVYRQPTFEEQDRMTKMLDGIIEMLATVNLASLDRHHRNKLHLWFDVEQAMMDIDDAWSSKNENTRIVTLEVARERLHYVITAYLKRTGLPWSGRIQHE